MRVFIKKRIDARIEITPEDVAKVLWNMGHKDQIKVLNILSTIDSFHRVEAQSEAVAMDSELNINARELIKKMAEVIVETEGATNGED